MLNYGKSCLFDKIIPVDDLSQCYDHKSFAIFTQGIFDVSGLNTEKYWEIHNFLQSNQDKIAKIECYLLKHPLFNFPIVFYPLFQFVHHGQLGFKFMDKDGNTIRHMNLQLQNSAYPTTDTTAPFDLPITCKAVDFNNPDDQGKIVLNLNDQTAIYADLLEHKDYSTNNVIEMNKYTYFRSINLSFLKGTVNFNFFLQSYKIWRNLNTPNDTNNPVDTTIPPAVKDLNTLVCNQPDGKCGGNGDGSLFVFNGFSPAFISKNEGCILHYANIISTSGNSQNLTNQFDNLIKWVFSNVYCSKTKETGINSFSKHYITLSTSLLNYNWCLSSTGVDSGKLNTLFSKLRPSGTTGSRQPATWLDPTVKTWDLADESCALFDTLMANVATSKSLVQTSYTPNDPKNPSDFASKTVNDPTPPFLCQGENYNCETFARFMITMILNNNSWGATSNNDVNVQQLFDFNFGGTKLEGDMSFDNNLYRSYSMYWPVAIYDDGYENGVPESEFNSNPIFDKDRELYSKQAQLFKYLFNGKNIEAAKTTGNPLLELLSEFLSAPLLKQLMDSFASSNSQKGFNTATTVLTTLMYVLFLYNFLGVEEVFVVGYPLRKLSDTQQFKYDYFTTYDCQPSIYKFQIGKSSRAAIANNKCIEAYMNWLSNGETPNPIFGSFNTTNDPILTRIKDDMTKAYGEIQNLKKFNSDLQNDPSSCEAQYPRDIEAPLRAYCELKKTTNSITTNFGGVKNMGEDMFDIMSTLMENPTKIPKIFLETFSNFLSEIGNKIYEILTKYFGRFTTLCHQNYCFDPQILVQMQTTPNSLYGFPDFSRPTSGICSNLICSEDLTNQPKLIVQNHVKQPHVFTAKYKLLNPYYDLNKPNPNLGFIITLVICILVLLIVFTFIGYKIYKYYH